MEQLQLWKVLICALAVAMVVAAAPDQTLPGCNSTCEGGNVEIPYPFGIGYSSTQHGQPCFLEPKFNLSCNNSNLIYGSNVTALSINVTAHQMEVSFWVARSCNETNDTSPWMKTANFSVSRTENKLRTVGCNSFGLLAGVYDNSTYATGCVTQCYGKELKIDDGTCSGVGCCQVDIPPRMRDIRIAAATLSSDNLTRDWGRCSYSFVAKHDSYKFSTADLKSFPNKTLPLVLDWTVGDKNCSGFESNRGEYACKENSHCNDTDTDFGYRCTCDHGYQGNPYLGCTDIDECKTGKHSCISEQHCHNTDGSHICLCLKGQSGNGTKGSEGCHEKDVVTKVVIGVAATIVILFVVITSLYLIYQKRKLIKLREKYFKQNGGSILLQQLSTRENSPQMTQIFTEEQLKKATNNFDNSLIIGSGGFGTVYKGLLENNITVAIKKSKIVDESQKEQFINEVVVLSQINHRNVVKLLGCCLEREVPLLVYEFVESGTLFDFLHTERKINNETWKMRLRIAAEAAGALSYLHSAASIPIIHRDVKTSNILLDKTYTAKVSDFGASRLVPVDQTEIATMVQGTFGYLDPEYLRTSQLTEKSDVYSFGVVLVELLTGEKPHSFGRPEEKRSLSNHFLSCLKEDRLFDVLQVGIMNEENQKEIIEVAILAASCLRLNGEERPSMKEVATELDAIRQMEKHPWINRDQNLEETQCLLHEAPSSIYEHGDSNSHQYTDSIRDHVLIALDNGR
ncbi:putative wall-associated receptor kinase-like 16 [Cajanus cajan]|uniref:putative wall-associated receptor kinase-like 16 n=1 Tax=Cajanus cajan TaxID=3821 RepID=UPI00098DB2CD|nr:putative wall-associated receptor kinase-like 16 [Cajanus cajan]